MESSHIVTLSSPSPENMSKAQVKFLDALKQKLVQRGLVIAPESSPTDTLKARYSHLRATSGVLVFACCQWKAERLYRDQKPGILVPSEYCHILSAMAVAARKPLLVLREKALADRGSLRSGHTPNVVKLPNALSPDWLDGPEFKSVLDSWVDDVECFRHVFLGYSSKATDTANKLYKFLNESLKLRVFDWHEFRAGDTIWDSIERAERSTQCGVFLFMKDDKFSSASGAQFAPRDNVVYEAGYFAGAKGRKHSLIIREDGAKIPSDLGGLLYLTLRDRNDISSLESQMREFLGRMLNEPGVGK